MVFEYFQVSELSILLNWKEIILRGWKKHKKWGG